MIYVEAISTTLNDKRIVWESIFSPCIEAAEADTIATYDLVQYWILPKERLRDA